MWPGRTAAATFLVARPRLKPACAFARSMTAEWRRVPPSLTERSANGRGDRDPLPDLSGVGLPPSGRGRGRVQRRGPHAFRAWPYARGRDRGPGAGRGADRRADRPADAAGLARLVLDRRLPDRG